MRASADMNRPHVISRLTVSTLLGAALLAWAWPTYAHRMIQNTTTGRVTSGPAVSCNASGSFAHWNLRDIDWRLNTAGQGSDKAGAVQAAMASWSGFYHAGFDLNYAGTTTNGWSTDGTNTIVFATGNGCAGTCLALTALVLQSGQTIVESDITFNTAGYTFRIDGADHDTQAIATHELGHSLGIHHTEISSTPRPTMYATYFGTDGRSLHSDDRAALECSECKYCTATRFAQLKGSGGAFGGRKFATLNWCDDCITSTNVDVFRDGVKVRTTAATGAAGDMFIGNVSSANYWVCEAGQTTWFDSEVCSNVVTVSFQN